jgi:protoporphyrin/coproporphyrin ferrochelatase
VSQPYDAILIVAFGGPESMAEVMPFLENVLRGRNIPHERMIEVAHHYELFGGVSPLNQQIRDMIAALQAELDTHGPHLPIYWGNRNWHPLLTDTLQQMADDGVQNALAFFASAYSSYSGCRQYREDIARAQEAVGPAAPAVDKIRVFYNHPAFIQANADGVTAALAQIPAERRAQAHIAFTAHSIPQTMADNSRYVAQLEETSRLVAEAAGVTNWQLVYQSRSGPPHQPWLEPDIGDHLQTVHENGVADGVIADVVIADVVIAPIGFLSDHMEVIFDLDTEARQIAADLGLNMIRAATVGCHPAFITMIRELINERLTPDPTRLALGTHGPSHDVCPVDCCLPGGRRG